MGTNLLQNYIAAKPTIQPNVTIRPEQQTAKKVLPNFDIQKELDNKTFIKPLRGKGKLVNESITSVPQNFASGVIYNMKALKHAIQGKANDHELGKLNDVGLMGGMLAIAGYLSGMKNTPMLKGMEFIGPAAFLASMTLWPKVAIQLPAYLIHGVNVQKRYQDSFGRVKPFYQDPQFIPWDLYSDEQIQKIGDRMKVPKDIPNRRDFIQEKMRKLAIQNNTLWMLTAGFATPVMASLMCNAVQPYYAKYLDNKQNKKADQLLINIDNYAKKYNKNEISKTIEQLNREYNGKNVDKNLLEKLTEILGKNLDFVTEASLKKDISQILFDGSYSVTENTAANISKNIAQTLQKHKYSDDFIKTVNLDSEALIKLFNENGFVCNAGDVEIKKIVDKIIFSLSQRVLKYNEENPNNAKDIRKFRRDILSINEQHPIYNELHKTKASVYDAAMQSKFSSLAKILDDFSAKTTVLDDYALKKVGAAPETVLANYWNDVSKDLLKTFGFSQKELEQVRFDKNILGDMLRQKLEKIVSDKTTYDRVLTSLVEKMISLESKIKSSDIASHLLRGDTAQPEHTVYEKEVDRIFNGVASSIRNSGFEKTANAIAGHNNNAFGTAKAVQKAFVEERLLGVKSSFCRLLNTLDFYRRVATDPNALKPYGQAVPRGVMEELIELCKITTLSGHSSDFATKFFMMRDPNPEQDFSPLEAEGGKIKNKYLGQRAGTDIPGDKTFYQNAMKFMFEDGMHPDTQAILTKNATLKDEVTNYRRLILDKLGSEKYFWKPRHRVREAAETGSDIKFLLTGIAPDELFFKTGQQVFNSNKWLKIFGGFGAGLLGVTVLSQFFLGRLKTPKGGKND